MEATLIIRYNGTAKNFFDEGYYSTWHMPSVRDGWREFGLRSARYFSSAAPDAEEPGTLWICECVFDSGKDLEEALGAPVSKTLIADIKNFTDMTFSMGRLELL